MGFPRNTDVKKHLARKVHRATPQLALERLATPAEIASLIIPKKREALVLPVGREPEHA
jgi:hypothetical protein